MPVLLAVFETAGFRVKKGYIIERGCAGGYRYLRVTASKNIRRAVGAMRTLNVRTVIPVNTELPKGFKLPDPAAAVVRAAPFAARQLSKKGQTAVITAPKVSFDVGNVCKAILPYTRRLMLSCGPDTPLFAFRLLKEYGVAAIAEPSREMLREAELSVAFGPDGAAVNGILMKSGHIELKNAPPPPRGVSHDMWHGAMIESGAFEIGKIRIDNGAVMGYTTDSVTKD